MSEHALSHNHLGTWDNIEQNLIRNNLNLYHFHIQMEIPKILKIAKFRVEKVRISLAGPTYSESEGRDGMVKMCWSGVVCIWETSVL